MADIFSSIIGSPVARRVGVPQPTRLRRFDPDRPLCDEPVLVAGSGQHADGFAAWLDTRGIATLRELPSAAATSDDSGESPRLGGFVLDLSDARDPGDLDALRVIGAPALKTLARNARVVVIGTDPSTLSEVAHVATQRALEGAVRSIAQGAETRSNGQSRSRAEILVRWRAVCRRVPPVRTVGLRRRSGHPGGRHDRHQPATRPGRSRARWPSSPVRPVASAPRSPGSWRATGRPSSPSTSRPRVTRSRPSPTRSTAPRCRSTSPRPTPAAASSSTPCHGTVPSTSSCTTPASRETSSSPTWTSLGGGACCRSTCARSSR